MSGETSFPPRVVGHLEGWDLTWARLISVAGGSVSAEEWRAVHDGLRERIGEDGLAASAEVAAIRRLFRSAGTDPTRYRPSSEALARRVLKGGELPRINPLVDFNNMLSLELLLPCCVIDAESVTPPFELRAGASGETMESMRGPFGLERKPLLADTVGPFGTPITDAERVKITSATTEAWLVVYGTQAVSVDVLGTLREMLDRAPIGELLATS